MKFKRHFILSTLGLIAIGGLYYGFLQSNSAIEGAPLDGKKVKSVSIPASSSENRDAVTSSFEKVALPQKPEATDSDHSNHRANNSRIELNVKQAEPSQMPSQKSSIAKRNDSDKSNASTEEVVDAELEQPKLPSGIRLAPDVRLPLAAMPNDFKFNPIKQKALQNIIDGYYRKVAAVASTSESNATAQLTVTEENGEETRIIPNGPDVESARKQADILFKTIFGDAAYNRMSMNTLLESRLPQNNLEQ